MIDEVLYPLPNTDSTDSAFRVMVSAHFFGDVAYERNLSTQ